jgi:hypothetical protein
VAVNTILASKTFLHAVLGVHVSVPCAPTSFHLLHGDHLWKRIRLATNKKKSHTEEFKVPKQFRQDEDATSSVQLGFISKNDFPLHIKTPQRESKIENVRNHRPV